MAQAGPTGRSPEAWADQVRSAGPPGYDGPWPRLSIWHGGMDTVVDPTNAHLLAGQWRALHRLPEAPSAATQDGQVRHEVWGAPDEPKVELWTIPSMPHGYPVAAAAVPSLAVPSSAVLPVGISATQRIARFWGLG
jgi:feruloyl esterase